MSHRPVSKTEDVVQVNDELTLKVIRVDPNERRIGLSLKELATDLAVPTEDSEEHRGGGRRGRRRDRDRYSDDDDD
jgi:4-hydroxy-3-methylbut-2-enyl diphosphate reductase